MIRGLLCALALWPAVACAEATLVARGIWPETGGVSALELTEDGTSAIALSDRGTLLRGRFRREGGILTVVTTERRELEGPPPLAPAGDTEGLALAPDGRLFLSVEGANRVRLQPRAGRPRDLPAPREFSRFRSNAGLEALAVDAAGALWTLPEEPRDGYFPLYRFDRNGWRLRMRLGATEAFRMVGADFGPDGKLYLLQRDFDGIAVRSLVTRIDVRTGEAEEVLRTQRGRHGNLEGLAVWRDSAGSIRLTMVADDNFRRILPTEIAEYRLD
ncbi:esterase-like activity of phytase family protein [Histidinibacterium aquaticum]|uniref:Esterase-like activity of phytase family protein n=1 Tax=Histidinibacterium aquaticum TaxID=2613962 RepID=A0A5J5GFL5_9RHOB|nr:esterase-like activity of phytase family protein [Histidinibacterium aquaticum]KAA9006975.1 esterase-like activity of phytase family protein [Histidinibacterium aquaticum]